MGECHALLTIAKHTVLDDEPASLPALAVVDPLAEVALEIGRGAVGVELGHVVLIGLVGDCR